MKQAIALIMLTAVFFVPAEVFAASNHIEYNIVVESDSSAFWTIIHVTDIDYPVDDWEEFEQRIVSIIDASRDKTARDLALDWESLEMNTEMHWETSSKKVTYKFRWLNFSVVEKGQISFGDVFNDMFFSQLQGDGELYVTYPAGYSLSPASLSPDQRDDSTRTLHWYRTQDFLVREGSVLLVTGTDSIEAPNLLVVGALGSGGLLVVAAGLFFFRQRRRQKERLLKSVSAPSWVKVESDQDKVLNLIKASGGTLKQSEICDKLQFSRAKTSMLLTEMEKNSLIKRDKKGKNKIVFPVENQEGRNL